MVILEERKPTIDNTQYEIEEKKSDIELDGDKKEILKYKFDKEKTFEENAKDLSTVLATQEVFKDENFVVEITKNKKKELEEVSKSNLKTEQAKSKIADKEYQQSLFGIYEGLSSYMGIKRALPKTMLKILMFIAQPILLIVFLVFGILSGIINICMDALNSIVDRFVNLADSTKKLIKSLFVIGLIILGVYLIRFGLSYFELI